VKAQKTADEPIKSKEKVELNPDQIHIKNLTIDDCGMKDADFATLMDALISQGKLKSITYINNEFAEQSVKALSRILGNSGTIGSQDQHFQHLECLRLGNLKVGSQNCPGTLIYDLMVAVDDYCLKNPLKRLKLQELELGYETPDYSTVHYISGQFNLNPGLLELDISHSKLLPRQLSSLMAALARQYTDVAGNSQPKMMM
jgi:hypothetical protein